MDEALTNLFTIGSTATLFTKVVIDAIRTSVPAETPLPAWVSPAMAFLFGPAFTAVLLVFLNTPFTAQTWATVVLAGVVAAAGAIGVTLLQRKAT